MHKPELVLLGGPYSGKTHYAGQLYGRLKRRPGALRLRPGQGGTPADLTPFEEVLACLEEGRAAQHTHVDAWAEVLLPIEDRQGKAMDLLWPDYGGEQLTKVIFQQREVQERWLPRLREAQGWLLLIRLKNETVYEDALEQLAARPPERRDGPTLRASTWDANARWVELLQILLHAAGAGTVDRLHQPRLAVLLSCYGELEVSAEQPPRTTLAQRLPLLAAFIDSVWQSHAVSVWGLSALERTLDEHGADESFIDQGPEHQGWVIAPEGGEHNPDLSLPLAWLLEQA